MFPRAACLIVAACLVATGCRQFPSSVVLRQDARDRRLALGKSDTVVGTISHSDAANVYVVVDGQLEAVPRADIVALDHREARQTRTVGYVLVGVGAVAVVAGLLARDCGPNDDALECAFESRRSFAASLAALGGFVAIGYGVVAVGTGTADIGRADRAAGPIGPAATGWWITPTPIRTATGAAPGVGVGARF